MAIPVNNIFIAHPDQRLADPNGLEKKWKMWHSRDMTEMFRCRVDKALLDQAHQVSREMGTTTGEMVRIFMHQMVKRRGLPFPMKSDDNSDILPERNRQTETLAKFYE